MTTIEQIKQLREETGLGIANCKEALEVGGDIAGARRHIRETVGKITLGPVKSGTNGIVTFGVYDAGKRISMTMLELSTETDFAARTDSVKDLAKKIANRSAMLDLRSKEEVPDEDIKLLNAQTGESISIRRLDTLSVAFPDEVHDRRIGSYVHHDNSIAVGAVFWGEIDAETMRKVCMHIASYTPQAVVWSPSSVPESCISEERSIAEKKAVGKPTEIAERIINGTVDKARSNLALSEQPFVMDPSKKIKDVVGENVTIVSWKRWQVGEDFE